MALLFIIEQIFFQILLLLASVLRGQWRKANMNFSPRRLKPLDQKQSGLSIMVQGFTLTWASSWNSGLQGWTVVYYLCFNN